MKTVLINKEGNSVKFEITIDAAEFEKAVQTAYNRTKSRYNIPGFRKGKAPRKIIELNYGKGVFFEDAMDIVLSDAYPKAIDELNLHPVSQPKLSIKEVSDDNSTTLEFEVDVVPEFDLPEYKGVEIEKIVKEASDEDINSEIDKLRERQARILEVEGPVESGYIANIDFDGYLDGELFDGGSAQGYSIVVGEGGFIPGFEDQMVGKPVGEEFDVNVTFPEDYPSEELAGKPVVFKVTVNKLEKKELPELNDDFVKDTTEFESVEELRNDIKTKLDIDLAKLANDEMRTKLVEKLVEKLDIEIPEAMVEDRLDNMLSEMDMQLSYQGWSIEKFCEFSGQTVEEIRESRRKEALEEVKKSLLISKIMEAENIQASDEDVEADMQQFASAYGLDIEAIKKNIGKNELEGIRNKLSINKTLDFLMDSAKMI